MNRFPVPFVVNKSKYHISSLALLGSLTGSNGDTLVEIKSLDAYAVFDCNGEWKGTLEHYIQKINREYLLITPKKPNSNDGFYTPEVIRYDGTTIRKLLEYKCDEYRLPDIAYAHNKLVLMDIRKQRIDVFGENFEHLYWFIDESIHDFIYETQTNSTDHYIFSNDIIVVSSHNCFTIWKKGQLILSERLPFKPDRLVELPGELLLIIERPFDQKRVPLLRKLSGSEVDISAIDFDGFLENDKEGRYYSTTVVGNTIFFNSGKEMLELSLDAQKPIWKHKRNLIIVGVIDDPHLTTKALVRLKKNSVSGDKLLLCDSTMNTFDTIHDVVSFQILENNSFMVHHSKGIGRIYSCDTNRFIPVFDYRWSNFSDRESEWTALPHQRFLVREDVEKGRRLTWITSAGDPISIFQNINDSDLRSFDLDLDLSIVFVLEGRTLDGLAVSTDQAYSFKYDDKTRQIKKSRLTSSQDLDKITKKIATRLKKNSKSNSEIMISIRSFWASKLLQELSPEACDSIQGLQVTNAEVLQSLAGFLPSLNLKLLQISNLSDSTEDLVIYGCITQRLHFFNCPSLRSVQYANCHISEVTQSACPQLDEDSLKDFATEALV